MHDFDKHYFQSPKIITMNSPPDYMPSSSIMMKMLNDQEKRLGTRSV